jgi:hypothetical protein
MLQRRVKKFTSAQPGQNTSSHGVPASNAAQIAEATFFARL